MTRTKFWGNLGGPARAPSGANVKTPLNGATATMSLTINGTQMMDIIPQVFA